MDAPPPYSASATTEKGRDLRVPLNYTHYSGSRPYLYTKKRTDAERAASEHKQDHDLQSLPVEVTVRDGRGKNLTLDENSFQLVPHKLAQPAEYFYDSSDAVIRTEYYPQMAALIQQHTGAAYVRVFHHNVRNEARVGKGAQGYARGIHTDANAHHSESLFVKFAHGAEARKYRTGRFLYINAWRPIGAGPVLNNHLAVLDETSTIKPDDYISSDLYTDHGKIEQYRLSDRNSAQHRWFYFPQMQRDEVILFKQWDSETGLPARTCFHTAFEEPRAAGASPLPPRESIEVRAIAYFPDAARNTCPPVPTAMEAAGGDPDVLVESAIQRIINALRVFPSWSEPGKAWLRSMGALGDGGIVAALRSIVEDTGNHNNLRDVPQPLKDRIFEKLLSINAQENVRQALAADVPAATGEDGAANATAQRIIAAIESFGHWDAQGKTWLRSMAALGSDGITAAVRTMVEDPGNRLGMRDAPQQTKDRVFQRLVAMNAQEVVRRIVASNPA